MVPDKRVRRPWTAKDLLLLAGLCVLSAWIGWQVVATTAADGLARADPATALKWRSGSSTALTRLAERQLVSAKTDADLAQVAGLARQALSANPLEKDALRVLALVAERQDDPAGAASLMTIAGERSLGDARVQSWLLTDALRKGDFEHAFFRLDAILRAWPSLGDQFLPAIVALANYRDARPFLVARLAADPPWRSWLVGRLVQSVEPTALSQLFLALKATTSPPSSEELQQFIGRLVKDGSFELAYLNWLQLLPPERLPAVQRIYNGDFEEPLSEMPFDWVIGAVRGAKAEIARDVETNELALRVAFYATQVPFQHVSEVLLLPSGWYRLTGKVRAMDFKNDRGMQWTINCADTGTVLGSTPRVSGTSSWVAFELVFEVKAVEECRAQTIRLELAARIAAEQEASGEIWYDDLRITSANRPESAALP